MLTVLEVLLFEKCLQGLYLLGILMVILEQAGTYLSCREQSVQVVYTIKALLNL